MRMRPALLKSVRTGKTTETAHGKMRAYGDSGLQFRVSRVRV